MGGVGGLQDININKPMEIQAFLFIGIEKHTYSNGFLGICKQIIRKPYVFQWFSRFFHSKSMKTIHIPMVFQVFKVLGSLGGIWPQHLLICLPRLLRTLKTWNTIGICMVFIDFE